MRAWGAALLVALVAGTATAQQGTQLAPESAPVPEARPDDGAPQVPHLIPPEEMPDGATEEEAPDPASTPVEEEEEPTAAEDTAGGLSFGLDSEATDPSEVPSGPAESLTAPVEAAEEPQEDPGPPMPELLAETEAELAACLAALDGLGVAYARADPIKEADDRDCGIANPITVSEIAPGVTLEPPPTLRCGAALAAARWVADVALPLSRKLDGRGRLTALDQGTAYLCRPRADGETSEHAYGNALDVMAFRFETGDPIVVQPRSEDGTLEEAFQRAVEAGACLDFTTVLGPGQEDHDDHLHLDIKSRDGGFRICQ